MTMQDIIIFSPDLDVTPRQIAQAWNADDDCRAMARAELEQSQSKAFDPLLGEVLTFVTGAIAGGVIGNAAYELLKGVITKLWRQKHPSQPTPEIVYIEVTQANGSKMVVFRQTGMAGAIALPQVTTVSASGISPQALRETLAKHFSKDEMRVLLDDLGVDYENVFGDGTPKERAAQEVVRHVSRREQFDALVARVRRERPGVI